MRVKKKTLPPLAAKKKKKKNYSTPTSMPPPWKSNGAPLSSGLISVPLKLVFHSGHFCTWSCCKICKYMILSLKLHARSSRDANRVWQKIRKNRKFISIAYKLRADGAKPPLRKLFDIFDAKNLILYAQFTGSPHPNFHFFAILYNFLQMLSKKKKKKIFFFFLEIRNFFFLCPKIRNSE